MLLNNRKQNSQNFVLIFQSTIKCSARDKNLAKMKQEERCVEIGTFCSSRVLGACIIKRTTYCC
ncbi:conjugal transfer protein TraN, partial [Candidatus Bandiella numerosa]|uniref:conjugal transfer protein TraN n=1 Tax=Candidatus Bandiella numerosa TaxID=2570586 RepID=UPI001F457ABB